MPSTKTQLSRYFSLLNNMLGDSETARELRRDADTLEGRREILGREDVDIPFEERGDLGHEFLHYRGDGDFTLFIIKMIEYISIELSGLVNDGSLERGDKLEEATGFFDLISELTWESELKMEFEDVKHNLDQLTQFLLRHLPDESSGTNRRFRTSLIELLIKANTKPLAKDINTFAIEYRERHHVPC